MGRREDLSLRGRQEIIFREHKREHPAPPKITVLPAKDVPDNGLAKTPPMGWNSWNKFRNQVSDQLVRELADAMARNGMKDAGYLYVNMDDTWEAGRDAQGNIQTNERFPDRKSTRLNSSHLGISY